MTPCCAFTSGVSSLSSSRPTVARSRWPCSMLVNLARLVFSQSCSVLRSVVRRRLSIMVLIFSFCVASSARGVDLDRPRQVALGDGGRHLGDGAYLGGEVGRQHVDVAGQVLPGAGDAR